jgi:hypothetical protein
MKAAISTSLNNTLPRPTGHQVLSDPMKGKEKEYAADKQCRYPKDISDCVASAQ